MLVGNLGSARRAEVGSGGAAVLPEGTQIEWWVRSGDRWHVPSADVTTRDWLLDQAPVLKSAIRVPGGDVTASTYVTVQGRRDVVVWDLNNASPAPLAAAFVVRSGTGRPLRLDGTTVFEGDRAVAYLPSTPADVIAGPLEPQLDGATARRESASHDSLVGATEVAFVIPLLHRTSTRFAALLGVSSATASLSAPVLSALPDPEMVARGWSLAAASAPRVDGDGRRANSIRSLASAVLLQADVAARPTSSWQTRGALSYALARCGMHDDAVRLLDGLDDVQRRDGSLYEDRTDTTVELLAAVLTVARHAPSPVFGHALVPLIAGALEFVQRRAKQEPAVSQHAGLFREASLLLERVGEQRAARTARKVWESMGAGWPVATFAEPPQPAITSGAQLVPSNAQALANAVRTELDQLAYEVADGNVELFAGWDPATLAGTNVAIHDVSTPAGPVSVALRWHGERPALLWESHPAPEEQIVLRCSALDPSWRNDGVPSGEALLAAPVLHERFN